MSLDKVLNRPLFRQEALKKGALKPVKARIGQMVGAPTINTTGQMARNFPVAINQQGFFGRNIRPAMQRSGQFLKNNFGIRPLLSGAIPATGTGMLSDDILTKLGVTGPVKTGINVAASFAGLTPPGRIIGYGYAGLKGLGLLADKIRRDNFNPNLEYGTTAGQVTGLGGEPLANIDTSRMFGPIDPSKPKGRGAIKKAQEERTKLAQAEGSEVGIIKPDALKEPQNETQIGKTKIADLNKVVKNKRGEILKETVPVQTVAQQTAEPSGIDGGLSGPVGIEGQNISSKPPAPVKEIKKPKGKGTQAEQDANEIIKKQSPFAKQIEMAREIQSELLQGRSSMAKQVFLSQLAAGLMAGTTRKRGIGGALEVFGQALGPAVNNYAVMKLKENELENELMSDALEMSSDFLKAQNSVMADAQDHGFVKIIGAEGQLRNMAAKRLKDGTIQVAVPGEVDANGAQLFTTVPYGSYTGFVKGDFAATEQNKTLKNLSGAYKGLQFNQINLKILRAAKADKRVLAGPVGKLKLLTNRVSGAANDFGFSLGSSDKDAKDFFENNFLSEENIKSYAENEGLSTDEAEKKLRNDFETNKNKYKKDLEKYVKPSSQSESAQLEELAINQTITVYALANALKSKDRLTQKDIENAERLVNIFPGFKGQEQVIQSLEAIEKTLLKDIERIEGDYIDADFGDPVIIDTYRRKFNIGGTGLITPEAIIDKQASQGTLLNEFNK
jgi:hypothetical protein